MKTMAELYHQAITENLFNELSVDELMATLIDTEWEERQRRKIAGLIKRAAFSLQAVPSDLDYHPRPAAG